MSKLRNICARDAFYSDKFRFFLKGDFLADFKGNNTKVSLGAARLLMSEQQKSEQQDCSYQGEALSIRTAL